MDEGIVAQEKIPPLPEWAVETSPPTSESINQTMPPLPSWAMETFPPVSESIIQKTPPLPSWAREELPPVEEKIKPVGGEIGQVIGIPPTQVGPSKPTPTVEKPSFLKTLGGEFVDKIGGLVELGLTGASAMFAYPAGAATALGKVLADAQQGAFKKLDLAGAEELGNKIMEKFTYQPKTSFGQTSMQAIAAPFSVALEGLRSGAKAITSNPQAQAGIMIAGNASLAFLLPKLVKITRDTGRMVSKAIYEDSINTVVRKGIETGHSPEVMNVIENTIRENVTPGSILEEVKRSVGVRKAEVKEVVPRLTEPIVEAPVAKPEVPGEMAMRLRRRTDLKIAPEATRVAEVPTPVIPAVEPPKVVPAPPEALPGPIPAKPEMVIDVKRQPDGTIRITVPETVSPKVPVVSTEMEGIIEHERRFGKERRVGPKLSPKELEDIIGHERRFVERRAEVLPVLKGKIRKKATLPEGYGGVGPGVEPFQPENLVGLEEWRYKDKMGLPQKKKYAPRAPKGLYKGTSEEDHFRLEAAKGIVSDIETGKMEWGDLNESEKGTVRDWFTSEVERLKKIESAGMMVEEGEPIPPEEPVEKITTFDLRRKLAAIMPKLGIPREKWGEVSRRVLENYKPEEGELENYIRRTASYLTPEGEVLPRPGEPKEVPIEKIPEPRGKELPVETTFERNEIKEIVRLSLDKLPDKEKKIAEGIMEGRSLREDAGLLKISHEAVREQRQKILSKLRQDESIRKLTSFDKTIEDIDAERRKGPKEEPPIGLTVKQVPISPRREVPKYEFADKERETEWQTGRRTKEPAGQRFHDYLTHIKNIWTRTYETLPNKPEFEEAKFQLKRLEKQRPISFYKTALVLRDIVPKDAGLYDRFSRKVILDDFAEEVKKGAQVLPFGFDKENVASELSKIDTEIAQYPELKMAIENRKKIWKSLRESYIEAQERIGNHVEDKLTREDYYRHQVLKYAEEKNRIKGTYKGLRTPAGRGFLKKRGAHGEVSVEPINIDYLEAESEVMAQMIHDIEIAKTLDKIHDKYGIEERLVAEGKSKGLDKEMSLSDERIPEGYRTYQPREGNVFYMANTISERAARDILQGGLEDLGANKVKVGQALAVGKERAKWVLPNEVADTLDNFMKRKQPNLLLNFDRKIILGWKKWILSGPTKILKYNARNISGDAEHLFVGNVGAFKKTPLAMKELYDVFVRNVPMTEDMKDWFDRGGMQTTLPEQEIKELSDFKSLYGRGDLRIENLPKATFKAYWKVAKMGANLRESILRYADYLDSLDQMKSNTEGRPKNFGASNPKSVMALEDIKDRAFKLSNDLIGAYDGITVGGQGMREFAWPFWSWLEVNPKIYFGLARNAVLDKNVSGFMGRKLIGTVAKAPITALRLGRFAVKAGAVYALVQAANHLLHKEEEDLLSEDVKNTQHIVLGTDKDGKTNYFSRIGALGDLFEWVGGVDNISDVLTGKQNLAAFLEKIGKGAVNQIVQGINPALKFAAEAFAKKTIFPDVFEPKPIRNLTLHFFRQLGLANEYLAVSDLPSRPYKEKLTEYAIYKSDPLEASYYDILDRKREWLKEKGKYSFTVEYTPKNNALYYMKLAHKYGDKESEKKFLTEYVSYVLIESGGQRSASDLEKKISTSIKRSFENMNPLFGIKKEYLPEFLKSLDELGKRRLAKSFQFYSETLIGNQNYKPEEKILESEKQ